MLRPRSAASSWLTALARQRAAWLAFFAVFAWFILAVTVKLPLLMNAAATATAERSVFADYFSAAILAVALCIAILAAPMRDTDRLNLTFLWAIKATVTLFFLPIYEAHYSNGLTLSLDSPLYFQVGALHFADLPPLAFGNGTNVMIWLIDWVTRVLPPYFHLLEMLWSFVGLVAIYIFYRGWRWLRPGLDARFLLWIGLFPSILFWSSILGKDPLTLLGIAIYFCAIAHWNVTRQTSLLALAAVGVLAASAVRPWLGIILAAPMLVFPLVSRRLGIWTKIGMVLFLGGTLYFAALTFLEHFGIESLSTLVSSANELSHSWADGGSATSLTKFNSLGGMIRFLPFGVFTALFRPLPGEVPNAFALLAGVENLVLLAALFLAIRRTSRRILRTPWVLWVISLLLIWSLMYAFPASQNLGTAARFKLQILPLLWPLLLILSRSSAKGARLPVSEANRLPHAHSGLSEQ